jgi:hypothetical protein
MAKIFGDYEINGELYLKSYSQQPYPLLLSTDAQGKVIFVDTAINSITASFPIVIDNKSISHADSGWLNKNNLTGKNIISNLNVTDKGHLVDWSIREMTTEDINAESAFDKGTIIQGNGLAIQGNLLNRLVFESGITFSHAITSTQSSVSNTNGNVIQSISLDTNFGHVTNISTINLDNRYIQSINLDYTSDIGQGTITNSTGGTNAIIPAANTSIAGLITTLTQSIAGDKTFTSAVTAPNFITTSDIRLKSEIKPIENALELISKFISYEYKKDGIKEAGFMAQEIREVIPYTVFENSDGILTMSDRPILAYLHKAILELKEEIEKIKK